MKKIISILCILIAFTMSEARPKKNHSKKHKKTQHRVLTKKSKSKQMKSKSPKKVEIIGESHSGQNLNNTPNDQDKYAAENGKALLKELSRATDNEEKARLYSQLSSNYQYSPQIELVFKSIGYIKKAIEYSKLNENKSIYHSQLAVILSSQKPLDIDSIKKEYEKAIELTEFKANKSYYYSQLGSIYLAKEVPDYESSLKSYKDALENASSENEKSNIYATIASLFYYDKNKHVENYLKAIEHSSEDENKSYYYSAIGNYYLTPYGTIQDADFEIGKDYMNKAISITKNLTTKAQYHSVLASAYKHKQTIDSSEIEKHLEKAIELSQNAYDKSYYLSQLGAVLAEKKIPEIDKAIQQYENAAKLTTDNYSLKSYKNAIAILKKRKAQ